MLTNPVVLSVIIMTILCLLKLNVILALVIAAIAGGLLAGMPIGDVMGTLIGGMGGNAETALSYILLGTLAVALHKTGLTELLSNAVVKGMKDKRMIIIWILAAIACLSQNAIPVHIAFIPILVPPLLGIMNALKIDRRAAACALTFGLKAPYIALPVGFGLIFHGIISREMTANGMAVETSLVWRAMWLPGLAMVVGLVLAIFYFRKPREYKMDASLSNVEAAAALDYNKPAVKFGNKHVVALVGAFAALAIQLWLGSLPLGAIVGLGIMMAGGAIKWKEQDGFINSGIGMMGFIAFVMLVASGYGAVIRETGGVATLVESASGLMGGSQFIGAIVMILVGLIITMGIGTSFGTIPIIAAIFVPLAIAFGFSPLATIALIGTAAALGDAGSPASDSTLGPTAGLNADGQHDHIWDTCVPTFLFFNIPLVIVGVLAAMIL